MIYTIVVRGKPVPKERPRRGKYGNMYTPEKTKEYEKLIANNARMVIPEPLKGNVRIEIKLYTRKVTGDLDNYIKTILDGLNSVAYDDDKQVTTIYAQRFESEIERVEIYVSEDTGRR